MFWLGAARLQIVAFKLVGELLVTWITALSGISHHYPIITIILNFFLFLFFLQTKCMTSLWVCPPCCTGQSGWVSHTFGLNLAESRTRAYKSLCLAAAVRAKAWPRPSFILTAVPASGLLRLNSLLFLHIYILQWHRATVPTALFARRASCPQVEATSRCSARDSRPGPTSRTARDETRSTRARSHPIRAREGRAMQMPCHGCRYPEKGRPLLEYCAHSRAGHLYALAPVRKLQSYTFMQVHVILFWWISVEYRNKLFF